MSKGNPPKACGPLQRASGTVQGLSASSNMPDGGTGFRGSTSQCRYSHLPRSSVACWVPRSFAGYFRAHLGSSGACLLHPGPLPSQELHQRAAEGPNIGLTVPFLPASEHLGGSSFGVGTPFFAKGSKRIAAILRIAKGYPEILSCFNLKVEVQRSIQIDINKTNGGHESQAVDS